MKVAGVILVCLTVVSAWPRSPNPCPQSKLKFGRVRYRQKGRIARFVCNTGYALAGDRISFCVHGAWENPFPKCVRATCKPPPQHNSALIYPELGGAVLKFYCRSNFQLRGPSASYCDGHNWDNPLPTCFPTDSKPSLSCDFENESICGWNHDLNHDFNWRRQNFDTPSGTIGTGPSFDHTKGPGKDGYYMYIESSYRNENDTARLISPVYDKQPQDNNVCFEFYYHMFGETTGDLRVYMRKLSQPLLLNPQDAIFAKRGNQGDRWYRALLLLGPIDDEFQIIIEGVRGPGYVSDIAIDDVAIISDCKIDDETTVSTWETEGSSEPALIIESCENRCDTNATQSEVANYLTCDCDDRCLERSRCCPDYVDFCITGTTDDLEVTEVSSTSSEVPSTTAVPSKTTTTKPKIITTTKPKIITTTKSKIITTTTKPKIIPRTTKRKIIATTTKSSMIVYLMPDDRNDLSNDVGEIPEPTGFVEEETPFLPVRAATTIPPQKNLVGHQRIVVDHKGESNTKTTVFVVGLAFGLLFGLVVTVFIVKKYHLISCYRLKRMHHSSNGDSQSDVRYLTGDEILNLTLDYDDSS